jgi:dimeric dUTPase (all-alpha-NTP-PPase superfamily)
MRDAVLAMLKMQDRMNRRVHPEWEVQGFAWHRAIWVECAELVDHHGYKWWKHQEADMPQVQLEVIDIWHFGMSSRLTATSDMDTLSQTLAAELAAGAQIAGSVLETSDALAGIAAGERRFCGVAFANLMAATGLDFAELYRQYLGKNVLNFFRQDNGYKDGSYRKVWAGREDNEHLMELLPDIDTADSAAETALYGALAVRYAETA